MITAALYGYIQPFEELHVNILETVLSINTLILLLLRNTEDIEDTLDTLEGQLPRNEMVCQDKIRGVTIFSWLLMPFYYLPLIISCTFGGVWAFIRIR